MKYSYEQIMKLLETPRAVTFVKRENDKQRVIKQATIGSLNDISPPQQTGVQDLITVACSEQGGYRCFYADSVTDIQ